MRVHCALLMALAGLPAAAQPAIQTVVNAASRIPPELPGGWLAPGARFLVFGERLGPTPHVRASGRAGQIELAGVQVEIQQGSQVFAAPLISAGAGVLEGLVPDQIPPGPVTIQVQYRKRASRRIPSAVAPSNPGLYRNAMVRGRKLMLPVTGLGTGDSPRLHILVGERRATVQHIERGPAGIDTLTVLLPSDVEEGCAVPVVAMSASGTPSNTVPISIGPAPCPALKASRAALRDGGRAGSVLLVRAGVRLDASDGSPYGFTADYLVASFFSQPGPEGPLQPFLEIPPAGACMTFAAPVNPGDLASSLVRLAAGETQVLEAGPALQVEGGRRAEVPLDHEAPGLYSARLGGEAPDAEPLPPFFGDSPVRISAAGGSGAGPFSFSLRMPPPPRWLDPEPVTRVRRKNGATLRWAPQPDPMTIAGFNLDGPTRTGAFFLCRETGAAGRFTIPPHALLSLPPTRPDQNRSLGFLLLLRGLQAEPARFEAKGLDFATAYPLQLAARSVVFE